MRHSVPTAARRARVAVVALFVINGALSASIVPRLPTIKANLELSNAQLGSAIAAMPVGSLIIGGLAGVIIAKVGSARLAVITCALGGAMLSAFGLAPAWVPLILTYLVFGMLDAITDVAMNAHGLRVQRVYRRSIINSFHGWWSVGAVGGGLLGSGAAGLGVPVPVHLGVVGAVLSVCALVSLRFTLPGNEHSERTDMATGRRSSLRPIARMLIMLGVITLAAAIVEDSASSWGSLFMIEQAHVGPAIGGLAFVACQGFQTVGRFTADSAVERFGPILVARVGGGLATLGMLAVLAIPHPVVIIAGWGLAGFGIASIFPGTFHAAGNLPGVTTGAGVTIVSYIARVGFLVSPPLVGLISDQVGLRIGLILVPCAALAITLLAGALRPPDRRPVG